MTEPAEKSRTSAQLNWTMLVASSCLGFVQWALVSSRDNQNQSELDERALLVSLLPALSTSVT
jgi:hypothetical protein